MNKYSFLHWRYGQNQAFNRIEGIVRKVALHGNGNLKPLFFVGSGRSGNTLLRFLLMSRAKIYIPPETYVLGELLQFLRYHPFLGWNDVVRITAAWFEYYPEFFHFNIPSLANFVNNICAESEENCNIESLINNLYMYFGNCHGIEFQIWGDKTPYNTFFIPQIATTFPRARFVYLVRDGVDVVGSYVQSRLQDSYISAARRWISANKCAERFEAIAPERVKRVFYEELASNPERIIKNLIEWLDIEMRGTSEEDIQIVHSALKDVTSLRHHGNTLNAVTTSSIGKGRKSIGHADKQALAPLMDSMLERLGYERCVS